MTYILRESELTTDNQLEELVKFTNFKSGKVPSIDLNLRAIYPSPLI